MQPWTQNGNMFGFLNSNVGIDGGFEHYEIIYNLWIEVAEILIFRWNYRVEAIVLTALISVSVVASGVSVSAVVDWVGSGDLVWSAHGLVLSVLVGVLDAIASAGLLGGVSLVVSVSTSGVSVSAVVESVSVVSVSSVVESVSLVVSGIVSVVVVLCDLVGSRVAAVVSTRLELMS